MVKPSTLFGLGGLDGHVSNLRLTTCGWKVKVNFGVWSKNRKIHWWFREKLAEVWKNTRFPSTSPWRLWSIMENIAKRWWSESLYFGRIDTFWYFLSISWADTGTQTRTRTHIIYTCISSIHIYNHIHLSFATWHCLHQLGPHLVFESYVLVRHRLQFVDS